MAIGKRLCSDCHPCVQKELTDVFMVESAHDLLFKMFMESLCGALILSILHQEEKATK